MKEQKKSKTKTIRDCSGKSSSAITNPVGEETSESNLQIKQSGRVRGRQLGDDIFDQADEKPFAPRDCDVEVFTESIEASIGYSSLVRQLNESVRDRITFFLSTEGGALSPDEVREKLFRKAEDREDAQKLFNSLRRVPVDGITFGELDQLWQAAPRVAERFWELVKREGRKQFESGHLAANALFPTRQSKSAWNIARFLGIRESFMQEWRPKGGIEIGMIEMLTQNYWLWQSWMEETVLRSQMVLGRENSEFRRHKEWNGGAEEYGSAVAVCLNTYDRDQKALDSAAQMTDRWQRAYVRRRRQLRDFRRYSPVTINNAKQVNIATDGGKQVNSSE